MTRLTRRAFVLTWKRELKNFTYILVSVSLLAGIFAMTVQERAPYFGKFSKRGFDATTAHVLNTVSNWSETGAFHRRFLSSLGPDTADARANALNVPYVSYPSGVFLIPHFISQISGISISLKFLNVLGLIVEVLTALILFLIALRLLEGRSAEVRAFGAFSSAAAYFLYPGPMYLHQQIFIFDTVVILPYLVVVYCELALVEGGKNRRLWQSVQYAFLFIASSIDWLSFFLSAGLIFLRVLRGETLKASIRLLFPFTFAMVIFLWQIRIPEGLFALVLRFEQRAGVFYTDYTTVSQFLQHFWGGWFAFQFGSLAIVIVLGSVLMLLVPGFRKNSVSFFTTVFLLVVPTLLQIHIFRNHSAVHAFSPLKLAPLICLAPVSLSVFQKNSRWLLGVLCLASLTYATFVHRTWRNCFPASDVAGMKLASQIKQNTEPTDFIVSPDVSIGMSPNHLISISRRMVHQVTKVDQARALVSQWGLNPTHWVVILKAPTSDGYTIIPFSPEAWARLTPGTKLAELGSAIPRVGWNE